jgi:hypothetical protein
MTNVTELEGLIERHLSKLAIEIGPRSIGTDSNAQAFSYIKDVVALSGAEVTIHETIIDISLPTRWKCVVDSDEVLILPGASTLALHVRDAPVIKRVYAPREDFAQFPPQPGSKVVMALG